MLGVSVKSKARFELGADDVIENENLSTKSHTFSEVADLTIICGSLRFHVERKTLCSKSSALAAMCEEASIVDPLADEDVAALYHLLEFIHHGRYTPEKKTKGFFQRTDNVAEPQGAALLGPLKGTLRRNKASMNLSNKVSHETPNLAIHVKVYELAEKCKVEDLKQLAKDSFHSLIAEHNMCTDLELSIG